MLHVLLASFPSLLGLPTSLLQGGPCAAQAGVEVAGASTAGSAGYHRLELGGAPLVGFPIHLEVVDALPLAPGALFLSLGEASLALPAFGAVFLPAQPFFSQGFAVGADGTSPPLLQQAPVATALCGLSAVVQAIVLDPAATGGVAFTHAVRVAFGAAGEGPVLPGPTFATSNGSLLPVGDLNGDLVPDLVLTGASSTSVLLGTGSGSFAPPAIVQTGGLGALGDLDQDGVLDLVLADIFGDVAVLLGVGDGTFAAPLVLSATGSVGITLADVDVDGLPDIVTAPSFFGPGQVSTFLGLGGGAFAAPLTSPFGSEPIYSPGGMVADDLDGDGTPDIVLSLPLQQALVFLEGAGDGTFAPEPLIPVAGAARALVLANLDGNAARDLCVATAEGLVATFLGAGDGTFLAAGSFPAGGAHAGIAAGDLDGDQRDDIVVANSSSGRTTVLAGNGDGTLGAPVTYAAGGGGIAMSDLDADGRLDAVAAAGEVTVLLGQGDGSLRGPQLVPCATSAIAVAIGDLDGDQVADLVAASYWQDLLVVVPGLGGGAFGAPAQHATGDNPRDVLLVDLDLDLVLDAVTANSMSGDVSVFRGQGDGGFAPAQPYAVGSALTTLVAADFDGDAAPDLAVGSALGESMVLLGGGDGTLGAPAPLAAAPSIVFDLVVADVDADGVLDLVSAMGSPSHGAAVHLGLGDGSFLPPQPISSSGSGSIAVADLALDGFPDVLVGSEAGYQEGRIAVLTGQGGGAFLQTQVFTVDGVPMGLVVRDLDGDLFPDLAMALLSFEVGRVGFARSVGDGSLDVWKPFAAGEPGSIAVGDLDGDLIPDLALGVTGGISVLRNGLLD